MPLMIPHYATVHKAGQQTVDTGIIPAYMQHTSSECVSADRLVVCLYNNRLVHPSFHLMQMCTKQASIQ